jgi:hypothetical protein
VRILRGKRQRHHQDPWKVYTDDELAHLAESNGVIRTGYVATFMELLEEGRGTLGRCHRTITRAAARPA